MEDIFFKDLDEIHYNFIIDSWLKSFKNSYEGVYQDLDNYNKFYNKMIKSILKKKDTKILVKKDGSVIEGYLIYGQDVLHYVYVRRSQRKNGLGSNLIKEKLDLDSKTQITFITGHFIKMFEKKFKTKINERFIFNPFLRY